MEKATVELMRDELQKQSFRLFSHHEKSFSEPCARLHREVLSSSCSQAKKQSGLLSVGQIQAEFPGQCSELKPY